MGTLSAALIYIDNSSFFCGFKNGFLEMQFRLLNKLQCTHTIHTIRKCKKMAGQNTFEILLLNDANMRTLGNKNEMPNMCPFEERHYLTWIDLNSGFGRN